jgi:hypothetical protein
VFNFPLQRDWHKFQITPSPQNLATLMIARYKRLQFQLPHTPRPECGAGGVMVGLGEGAKRDASASSQPLIIFCF